MTLGTKSLLVLSLSLSAALFAACKKKEPAAGSGTATGTGTATASAAVVDAAATAPAVDAAEAAPAVDAAEAAAADPMSLTPELKAVGDTIKPILAMPDGDDKNKAACKALDTITTQIAAVRKAPPAGVDPGEWTAATESMAGGFSDMAIECGEGESPNLKALTNALEAGAEFQALMAKKAP